MKKIITVIFTAACFWATQYTKAQTVSEFRMMPPLKKAQLLTDSLKQILKLSPDQYNKAYTIILDVVKKAAPVVKSNGSRLEKGQKLKGLMAQGEEKMKQVLSQAQFDVFETKKQQAIAYYRQHIGDEKLVFNAPE